MDAKQAEKASLNKKDWSKDHKLKYIALQHTFAERVGKLREIIESLPQGKQKATATQIIDWLLLIFQDIMKDAKGLEEGSELRNIVANMTGYVSFKEQEANDYLEVIKSLSAKLNDKSRGSIKEDSDKV